MVASAGHVVNNDTLIKFPQLVNRVNMLIYCSGNIEPDGHLPYQLIA